MNEFWEFWGFIILGMILLFGVVFGGTYLVASRQVKLFNQACKTNYSVIDYMFAGDEIKRIEGFDKEPQPVKAEVILK